MNNKKFKRLIKECVEKYDKDRRVIKADPVEEEK